MTTLALVSVPLEPVRSAEPPTSPGTTGSSFSRTFCEDCRVASLAFSRVKSALSSVDRRDDGAPHFIVDRIGEPGARFRIEPLRGLRPSRHRRRGGACRQRASWRGSASASRRVDAAKASFSRAPLTSSSPSGEPCVAAVPALLGAP